MEKRKISQTMERFDKMAVIKREVIEVATRSLDRVEDEADLYKGYAKGDGENDVASLWSKCWIANIVVRNAIEDAMKLLLDNPSVFDQYIEDAIRESEEDGHDTI